MHRHRACSLVQLRLVAGRSLRGRSLDVVGILHRKVVASGKPGTTVVTERDPDRAYELGASVVAGVGDLGPIRGMHLHAEFAAHTEALLCVTVEHVPVALQRRFAECWQVIVVHMLHPLGMGQAVLGEHVLFQRPDETGLHHLCLSLGDPEGFAGWYLSGLHEGFRKKLLLLNAMRLVEMGKRFVRPDL